MLKKFWNWLTGAIGDIATWLEPRAEIAINVVNKIKDAVNNPLADAAVILIPGKYDDMVLVWLRKFLPLLVEEMMELEGVIKKDDTEHAITAFIYYLRSKPALARVKWYIELAGRILAGLAQKDKKTVDISYAAAVTQIVYKKMENVA